MKYPKIIGIVLLGGVALLAALGAVAIVIAVRFSTEVAWPETLGSLSGTLLIAGVAILVAKKLRRSLTEKSL